MMTYDGFPVDVTEDRETCGDPTCFCAVQEYDEDGYPPNYSREKKRGADGFPEFTEADLMRLAEQLERAELQGYRFERYDRCRVGGHRHRWEIVSKLCQIWTYIRRLKWQ